MKIFIVLLISFRGVSVWAQDHEPFIRFGLMADVQYCNCETRGTRFYQNSLKKLEDAVNCLNAQNVQFTINLGDNIDRNIEDLDPVLYRLGHLKNRGYNTPGNHDYHGIAKNKILYRKLNMPSNYYSFKKGSWMFIMLNTNEISTYANIVGTPLEQELLTMLDRIKSSGGRQGEIWNGGISGKQLKWLDNLLKRAEKSGKSVLIFSHHPLYPESAYTALNNMEILNVIDKYTCVKAIFSGHHHAGNFAYFGNIPVITIEGMVETENDNSFGIVNIYHDRIVLEGKGRVSSREF
jgi:beta-galactosidase